MPVLRPRYINHTINDRMSYMHALRPKFPSETLRQGSHSELACREGGTESGAFQGGGCAGEDNSWWVFEVGGVEEEGEDGLGEEVGTTSVEGAGSQSADLHSVIELLSSKALEAKREE